MAKHWYEIATPEQKQMIRAAHWRMKSSLISNWFGPQPMACCGRISGHEKSCFLRTPQK